MNYKFLMALTLLLVPTTTFAKGIGTSLDYGFASGSFGGDKIPLTLNGSDLARRDLGGLVSDSGTSMGLSIYYHVDINEQWMVGPMFRANYIGSSAGDAAREVVEQAGAEFDDDGVHVINGYIGPQGVYKPVHYLRASLSFGLGYGAVLWDWKFKGGGSFKEDFKGMTKALHLDCSYTPVPWFAVGPAFTYFSQSLNESDSDIDADVSWTVFSLLVQFNDF